MVLREEIHQALSKLWYTLGNVSWDVAGNEHSYKLLHCLTHSAIVEVDASQGDATLHMRTT